MVAGTTRPAGRKGPRPKHVPVRMCVTCREHGAKRSLTRLVRSPEGEIAIDPTGKRNGRGAYLCDRPECWERSLKSGALGRALNAEIDEETTAGLTAHAASMRQVAAPVADGGGR